MSVDWYSVHVQIDPIDTAEALQKALADPALRWYANRRLKALAATGALTAATWNPLAHPRGRDGKFIETFGWVRWLDTKFGWRSGWVSKIDPATGAIQVRHGPQTLEFADGSKLYAKPKPKARLNLPNVVTGDIPAGWVKVGSQGGSNPGGTFEIAMPTDEVSKWPEITSRSGGGHLIAQFSDSHDFGDITYGTPVQAGHDAVMVPSIDGKADRYDFAVRIGSQWYRIPDAPGSVIVDGHPNPDLAVSVEDLFGSDFDARRDKVVNDPNQSSFKLDPDYTLDDLARAVQGIATPPPKVGDQFYVKTMPTTERARNEALANDLYELLGVPVPDVSVGTDGKTVASKLIGDKIAFNPNNPDHVKVAQDAFVADAWLANWDAVGQSYDNMAVDQDGRVWRIDAGGALLYRAMVSSGEKGPMFGDNVGELDSLRNPAVNAQAAKVYGSISPTRMGDQGEVLRSISPQRIRDVVEANQMPDSLADRLIARRQSILDQLGLSDPNAIHDTSFSVSPTKTTEPTAAEDLADLYDKAGIAAPDAANPLYPGLTQAEIHQKLTTPTAGTKVLTDVGQMGVGPQVHVANYMQAIDMLTTSTLSPTAFDDAVFIQDIAIFKINGDLWAYDSELSRDDTNGTASMVATNLLTGERDSIMIADGVTEWLVDYQAGTPQTELLVDGLKVQRALAYEEITGKALKSGKSLNDIMYDPTMFVGVDGPSVFHHYEFGLPFDHVQKAIDDGRLGTTAEPWPIRDKLGQVWYVGFADDNEIRLTQAGGPTDTPPLEMLVPKDQWHDSGPYWRPGNETTAEIWKAKAEQQWLATYTGMQLPGDEKATLKNWEDTGYSGHDIPLDPDPHPADTPAFGYPPLAWSNNEQNWVEVPADKVAAWNAGTWTVDSGDAVPDGGNVKVADADLEALLNEEQEIYDKLHAADNPPAAPTVSQAVVGGVVAGMIPVGEPLLSTELDPDDVDALKAQLVGKNVVFLPPKMAEDPAANGNIEDMHDYGLATITDVQSKQSWSYAYHDADGNYHAGSQEQTIIIRYDFGDGVGRQLTAFSHDSSYNHPTLIQEVGVEVVPGKPVFKQNTGSVVLNGTVIGHWLDDAGETKVVIAGNYSITGSPMILTSWSKNEARNAVSHFAVPIVPPVKKTKPHKVYLTEQQIKDLNYKLTDVEFQIEVLGYKIADVAAPADTGGDVPLGDGTLPHKGDWVYSTKDGKYGQIGQVAPKFGSKNTKDPANYVKVKFTDPVTGKVVWNNRSRASLVSAPGPGEHPWVVETKAIMIGDSKWVGPGVKVGSTTLGTTGMVLDTSPDGLVKVKWQPGVLSGDGSTNWVPADMLVGHYGDDAVIIKHPVGTGKVDVASLNAQLADLQDVKKNLALEIAKGTAPPKKPKKPFATPYPGPNGLKVKQPASMAQDRENQDVKNLKDGYAPVVGQIVRYTDGSQWVVTRIGSEEFGGLSSSHKNSVKVVPVGSAWPEKWKQASTLVLDHDAMLTNKDTGQPLPVVTTIVGGHPDLVTSQLQFLYRVPAQKGYTDSSGKYRHINYDNWLAQDNRGTVWNLGTGTKVGKYQIQGAERVAYLDVNPVDGYTGPDPMTLTVQSGDKKGVGTVWWTAIHDPATNPATLLSSPKASQGQDVWIPGQSPGTSPPPGYVYDGLTDKYIAPPGLPPVWWDPQSGTWVSAAPALPPQPVLPGMPEPPPPIPVPAPTGGLTGGELPVYEGDETNLTKLTNPHDPTVKAGQTVAVFKPTGGTDLTAALPGTRSIMTAIADTVEDVDKNHGRDFKNGKWTAKFALADSDMIEDQTVSTQVERQRDVNLNDIDYIDVTFQLSRKAAKDAYSTFFTSNTGEIGDWDLSDQKKPQALTIGDQINVRVSHFETYTGKLKPSQNAAIPNAVISDGPTLVGKNPTGQFDVYRFEVITADGNVGYIDLEDRGQPSVWVATWDKTKPVTTNGAVSLNPLAKDDGWSVAHAKLGYEKQGSGHHQVNGDGSKMFAGPGNFLSAGQGYTIERDYEGANITLNTTDKRNALDGQVRIRVRADDPEAQRKISEAMEMVGVDVAHQQPPDKAALTKMALNKIWVQYRDHYNVDEVSNATLTDPSQAFNAVDKALGLTGDDKMTMDDISIAVHPDGRVQVLLSNRIADIIDSKNKVNYYTHKYYHSNTDEAVLGMVMGRTRGLMASNERYSHGLFYDGMSVEMDHPTNGARYTFTRGKRDHGDYVNGSGTPRAVFHPHAMHRQVDFYWRHEDKFGDRDPYTNTNFVTMSNMHDDNEFMVRRSIETEIFDRIVITEPKRSYYIDELHKQGITHAPNGRLLEDFFVVHFDPSMLQETDFGDEIKLTSIPDTAPAVPVA